MEVAASFLDDPLGRPAVARAGGLCLSEFVSARISRHMQLELAQTRRRTQGEGKPVKNPRSKVARGGARTKPAVVLTLLPCQPRKTRANVTPAFLNESFSKMEIASCYKQV